MTLLLRFASVLVVGLTLLTFPFLVGARRRRGQLERELQPVSAADRPLTGENGASNS